MKRGLLGGSLRVATTGDRHEEALCSILHAGLDLRLGRQRGSKVARVDIARCLAEANWHMLTKGEPFAPAGPAHSALVT